MWNSLLVGGVHRIAGARGRTFEGSGIGLALVAELARLHGGAVRAESEEGRGSRFTVTVPLASAHVPAERVGFYAEAMALALAPRIAPAVREAIAERHARWTHG